MVWVHIWDKKKTHSWCCQLSAHAVDRKQTQEQSTCALQGLHETWGTSSLIYISLFSKVACANLQFISVSWNVRMFLILQSRLIGSGQYKCKFQLNLVMGEGVLWDDWVTGLCVLVIQSRISGFCPIILTCFFYILKWFHEYSWKLTFILQLCKSNVSLSLVLFKLIVLNRWQVKADLVYHRC